MKYWSLVFLILLVGKKTSAQENINIKEVSRYWTHVNQKIELKSKLNRNFLLRGKFKIDSEDPVAKITLYCVKESINGDETPEYESSEKYTQEWEELEIQGIINNNTKVMEIGAFCENNGTFYFDDFELLVENDNGEMEKLEIPNNGFEKPLSKNGTIPDWDQGSEDGIPIRVKEFTVNTIFDEEQNSTVLVFEGKGIDSAPEAIGIEAEKGSKVEIEGMISMLDDLKNRVENQVKNLSQYELDYLHDDKANRIGALIMHLAAAEVYYQVFTFESRGFNDEEKEKWQVALDLDEGGRDAFQGKDVQYYLDIYNEVRAKTIEELRKHDDAWFKEVQRAYNWSNQYCWFHVMEHQSSHLGQILFLKKRIPPENKVELPEIIKN